MDNQAKQITELFAAPRGSLELVANFSGVKIYSSEILKQNFIKAMAKTSRVAPIIKTVEKLINTGFFIPCYLTDKIYKTILKKQPPEFKGYVGLTIGKHMMVFVDNDTNIFGFASNDELSITTLHELIHQASNKFPKEFLQTFKIEFTQFYYHYWASIFSTASNSLNPKDVQEIISYIYETSEHGTRSNKVLLKYHELLLKKFSDITTLNSEVFQKLVTDYIVLIKIIWKGIDSQVPSLIEKAVFANRNFITPLYTAYKTSFAINVKHIKELCYQELYAPSEVISLPALIKRPNSKVYKIINKL